MPGRRVRIDPSVQRDVAVWVIAYAQRYTRQVMIQPDSDDPDVRRAVCRQQQYARDTLVLLENVVRAIGETVSLADVNTARVVLGIDQPAGSTTEDASC